MTPAAASLANALESVAISDEVSLQLFRRVQEELLRDSRHVRQPDFTSIQVRDLESLFCIYDRLYFAGLLEQALGGQRLSFAFSKRMTRAGGRTTRHRLPSGEARYEIAIASSMLFDGFRESDRRVTVCGWECASRLDALQRIFEHELVHLAENLCWSHTNCSARRFQRIAANYFRHRVHTHNLVTRRERAAEAGIRPGTRVMFEYDGRRMLGRVNRITKRATVLVEDPQGRAFTDGKRYKVYYVPIAGLSVVQSKTLSL